MITRDTEALIYHRMVRPKESILAAEIMLEKGMLVFSMIRIYYAIKVRRKGRIYAKTEN